MGFESRLQEQVLNLNSLFQPRQYPEDSGYVKIVVLKLSGCLVICFIDNQPKVDKTGILRKLPPNKAHKNDCCSFIYWNYGVQTILYF